MKHALKFEPSHLEHESPIDRQIDANLKRIYESALNQELPKEFRDLIDRLKNDEDAADAS